MIFHLIHSHFYRLSFNLLIWMAKKITRAHIHIRLSDIWIRISGIYHLLSLLQLIFNLFIEPRSILFRPIRLSIWLLIRLIQMRHWFIVFIRRIYLNVHFNSSLLMINLVWIIAAFNFLGVSNVSRSFMITGFNLFKYLRSRSFHFCDQDIKE